MYLKKIGGIFLAGMLSVCMTACSGAAKTPQNADPVQNTASTADINEEEESDRIEGTITVWTDRWDLLNNKLPEYKLAFEEKYPGTEVIFKAYKGYETDVSEAIYLGEYADVLLIPHSVSDIDLEKYFEPLGSVEELSKDYREDYLQERQMNGMVFGLPRYVMPQGIVYNKKVFDKAEIVEIPQTPEEFLEALVQIQKTQPKVIPFFAGANVSGLLSKWQQHAWGSVSANENYHYNDILSEEKPFSQNKSNYTVHQLLYDIVADGLCEEEGSDYNWKTAQIMMNRGEIGCMLVDWKDIAGFQQADTNPDDIGYMPFPYNVDGVQYATATIDYCYAVNKNSNNKATARAWVEYMLNDSGFAVSEGAVSILNKDSLPTVLKNFADVQLVIDNSSNIENVNQYKYLNEESGILLDEDAGKRRIVEAAGAEDGESFKQIMKDWNNCWKKAQGGKDNTNMNENEKSTE